MFMHERLKSDLNLSLIIHQVSKMRTPRGSESQRGSERERNRETEKTEAE